MVPQRSGSRPNCPPAASLPAEENRGSQTVPKKKSNGETMLKKWIVSNNTDSTIPMVVNTATVDAASNPARITPSTILRVRSSGEMRL